MDPATDMLRSLLEGTSPRSEDAGSLLEAAEAALADGTDPGAGIWHRFLDASRLPAKLQALPDDAARRRWADVAIAAVECSGYTLETMLDQRVASHPDRIWLREVGDGASSWSFARARRKARAYAAALLQTRPSPRVALLTPNSLRGALVDVACLLHGIFITPLATQTEDETLAWIFDRLAIDVVAAGGDDQVQAALRAARLAAVPPRVLRLDEGPRDADVGFLEQIAAGLSTEDVDAALAAHPRFGLDETATVMFTSGSTGRPKGVAFTLLNLVSKRFARAAALPRVGDDEVLLCYLPLFHTFGRYLELLGTLFWGGEYVFAGNPSRETLLHLLPLVKPTGLISIPLRWAQMREACLARREALGEASRDPDDAEILRSLAGERLRWGLSAAGYLAPEVFRFFRRCGVTLCSGFGMTEATGGITMTPPDDYRDDSVGVPLPGMRVRLGEHDELEIAGPYVATYLDDDDSAAGERWLRTGDIFRLHDDGHLEIVDRLKDIYKNARGQTIAPRRVEQKYGGVPGIRRVFLVGDHRTDNVLLIVPDPSDPILQGDPHGDAADAYFRRIVHAANADLMSYERVVSFAVLDRDFDADREELTPKGTYRRKIIEEHFAGAIDDLYRSDVLSLPLPGAELRVPRWLVRELGVLESELEVVDGRLREQAGGRELIVAPVGDDRWRVGDLEYETSGRTLNLGLLVRQPLLWVGNPALVAFCPVRDGWDVPLRGVTQHVSLPAVRDDSASTVAAVDLGHLQDKRLPRLHELCREAFFGSGETALRAVEGLARALDIADHRTAELLRRRLDALCRHPEMPVRSAAYRVLLLDEPAPDYSQVRPRFLTSGLPFLDAENIAAITHGGLEERRLEAFRMRLHAYRRHLTWPTDATMRSQFDGIFTLLSHFARNGPAYYGAVRDELVTWVLLREDPELAALAERHVLELSDWYEKLLEETLPYHGEDAWQDRILYQDGLSEGEITRLEEILVGTTFLQQSVRLTSDGEELDIREVPREGIWIGRTAVRHRQRIYRISINTVRGKHYDLLLVVWDRDLLDEERDNLTTAIYWLIALGGHPHGTPVLPRFGCYRPTVGALSLAFVSDLSVWERIREYAGDWPQAPGEARDPNWRRLFIRALATFIRGWAVSGRRIVPGMVTPSNVAVPEPDFREGARILSLTGWVPYAGPLDLVRPMLRNFFKQTTVTYPWTTERLELSWICDACVEALGLESALDFLRELQDALSDQPHEGYRDLMAEVVARDLRRLEEAPYESCALRSAVARYRRWRRSNPDAAPRAREQLVEEMLHLYGLDASSELDRFLLYRQTWFQRASEPTRAAFDALLAGLHGEPDVPATRRVELTDLQETLKAPEDRRVFQRLAFPHSPGVESTELRTVGDSDHRQVIVATRIIDKNGAAYAVREPLEPADYGRLYRLFFTSGYYKTISEHDSFFIVLDAQERIVGGISWKNVDPDVVHLNGIVVATPLLGRGISSALIEDFCTRMANLGHAAVKTLFVLRPFFERHGFHLDKRWGGLVRLLH